ncbi:MAG TPA: hypothetical protein VGS10_11385 [Terracidiphilus sp.]|nr:hypothetical protein [Terracidiphilus sp.]
MIYTLSSMHRLHLADLTTPVTVTIWRTPEGQRVEAHVSHAIHTPAQASPVRPTLASNTDWTTCTNLRIARHIEVQYVTFYDMAVAAGHAPQEWWLVPVE